MTTGKRILEGGRVFTADAENPWTDAVVVDGDRIIFVGEAEAAATMAGDDAEHIEVDDGLVLPGFVDGHVHVTLTGSAMLKAYLRDAESSNTRLWGFADSLFANTEPAEPPPTMTKSY